MKTKTIITELTQEDLVDLLCTATYGSYWLEIYAPDKEGLQIDDSDCREDVWAKALLAGKKIQCIDHNAEEELYGDKGHIDEDGDAVYEIGLQDIYEGLQKAMDGTYADSCDCKRWARISAADFIKENLDNPRAECLMQVIMFNDVIY